MALCKNAVIHQRRSRLCGKACRRLQGIFLFSGKSPAACRELSRLPENVLQRAGSFPGTGKVLMVCRQYFPVSATVAWSFFLYRHCSFMVPCSESV